MFHIAICLSLLAVTVVVQSKYVYHPEINGWIKAHHFVATWEEAYQQCRDEEYATLASPITKGLRDAMKELIGDHETQYFIGTSSTFYPGQDFVSIEGIPLKDMEVTDMLAELDPKTGQCLSMDGHKIRIVSCKTQLPFMCYKQKVKSMPKNECGTRSDVTGYEFYPSTNSCYKLHGFEETSWDDANKGCAEEDAHLVVINDATEAEVVRGIVSNLTNTNGHIYVTIGMRDRTANGDWITVHGQRIEDVYNLWKIGQKSADDRYRCGRVYQTGELDNGVCYFGRPYLCEKDPYKVMFPVEGETRRPNNRL